MEAKASEVLTGVLRDSIQYQHTGNAGAGRSRGLL